MDIYQIIVTHNRSWTIREIIAFAVVFLIAAFLAAVLLKQHKIVVMQAVCGLLLLTFLAIVFGSTVFYEDYGDQAVSVGGVLVVEGNTGDW